MLQLIRKRTVLMINAGGVLLLVGGMAALSDDVKSHLSNAIFGDHATEFSMIAAPARDAMKVVTATVGGYTDQPGAVLAFGLGAVVLFCLMFRT